VKTIDAESGNDVFACELFGMAPDGPSGLVRREA